MNEDMISSVNSIFNTDTYECFYFDELNCYIKLKRDDSSKDSDIFIELDNITKGLISFGIDFSVDKDGTIILSAEQA